LYGYTPAEALGHNCVELLCSESTFPVASRIVARLCLGESWTGQFPLRKKSGEIFNAIVTNTPLYDDGGTLVGVIGVTSDARPKEKILNIQPDHITSYLSAGAKASTSHMKKTKEDWQSSWQLPFASSISSLVICLFASPHLYLLVCISPFVVTFH
jgi:hypothetical protein